jgi:hypothetical protein
MAYEAINQYRLAYNLKTQNTVPAGNVFKTVSCGHEPFGQISLIIGYIYVSPTLLSPSYARDRVKPGQRFPKRRANVLEMQRCITVSSRFNSAVKVSKW